LIKIHGNLNGPAFAALAEESRRLRIPLVGHAPRNLPFDSVIANRQVMVAHVEELLYTHYRRAGDTAGTGQLAERMRMAGVWLTPNLVAYTLIARQIGRPSVIDSVLRLPESAMLDSGMRQLWRSGVYTNRPLEDAPSYERNRRFLMDVTAGLNAGGVRMLAGTDTPLPGIYPGTSLIDELDLLTQAGLSRFDALAAATRTPVNSSPCMCAREYMWARSPRDRAPISCCSTRIRWMTLPRSAGPRVSWPEDDGSRARSWNGSYRE
jgi:hypothetical protein